MAYVTVPYTSYLPETIKALDDPGLLLVSQSRAGRPNAMVIGWGLIGIIWGRPVFTVLVRPSRFTYGMLDETPEFVVCVPNPDQLAVVDFCGNESGRVYDKFKELSLTPLPSTSVSVPGIDGCTIIYECRVLSTNDLLPDRTEDTIRQRSYLQGDWHRIYHGEILATRALKE